MAKADNTPGLTSPLPHLLDVEAIAEHLGVTVRHIRRLVAERRIPFLKWGHLVRFDPGEVAEWLDASRVATADRLRHHPGTAFTRLAGMSRPRGGRRGPAVGFRDEP